MSVGSILNLETASLYERRDFTVTSTIRFVISSTPLRGERITTTRTSPTTTGTFRARTETTSPRRVSTEYRGRPCNDCVDSVERRHTRLFL